MHPGERLRLLLGQLARHHSGGQRVDALLRLSLDPGHEERLPDLSFDAQADEVVLVPRVETVRGCPAINCACG
jgi:hypothetical protein